jgi:4-hydroxybenzoate polyprenyltransferase
VLNDLLDLPTDRRHPSKQARPLASGRISPSRALALVPALLAAAGAIALIVSPAFLAVLVLYFLLTLAYSLRIKEIAILDVLTVAGLYAMRVSAGAAAVEVTLSPWLFVFCIFLFLSLAMVKRYAELMTMRALDGPQAHARAYLLEDAELLAAFGAASGYLSVLVLALWISGEASHHEVSRHWLLWVNCGLLLYWISHVWLTAHRARMDDDPLIFALRDRVSRVLLALSCVVLLLASVPVGAALLP